MSNLSEVVDLIKSLGADARGAFIWWLVTQALTPIAIIWTLVWLTVWVMKTIRRWNIEDKDREARERAERYNKIGD